MGPLEGRVVLVTGVSRQAGIGYAIARRLIHDGASVFLHSWSAHDSGLPWGTDRGGITALLKSLGRAGPKLAHLELDLSVPEAAESLIKAVIRKFDALDIAVLSHARHALYSSQALEDITADELDRAWAVNARATLLLAKHFSITHDDTRPGGRIILFSSTQHLEPMPDEIPYALSKGAIQQITGTLAAHLAHRGITVNAVNPGPTDTGWAPREIIKRALPRFPQGRWGRPDDIARLVAWLASDESQWVTGQVINSEGGFTRSP